MNATRMWITAALVVLNLSALALLLAACRPRIVLVRWNDRARPARRRSWRPRGLRSGGRRATGVVPAPERPPEPAPRQPAEDSLADWIHEAENRDSAPAPHAQGSDEWWRAWAEGGGSLPPAAGACRPRSRGERA